MTNLLKNQKLNNVVDISKCVYLCIFTVYLVAREIYALIYFIDSFYVTGFFTGFAFLFIGYDILTKHNCLKTRYFPATVLFLITTVISCMLNREYGIFANIKSLIILSLYFFLLYPEAFNNKSNRTLSACLNTGFFTLSIFSLASLPMYIYDINYVCDNGVEQKQQGFVTIVGRLWGVFHDPNYFSLFSLIAICSSIYLFVKSKSIFKKVVLVLLDVIHAIVLTMTGSKTGFVITVAAIIWLSVIVVFKKFSIKTIYRIMALVLAIIISATAPFIISKTIQGFMPIVKKVVLNLGDIETYTNVHKAYDKFYTTGNLKLIEGSIEQINIDENVLDGDNSPVDRIDAPTDFSNGRLERWKDALELTAERPFFGLSPRNIIIFANENDTDTLMNTLDTAIHNTYLELLAGTGIIGGFIMLIFLILAAVCVIKTTLNSSHDLKIVISSTLVLIIALAAVFLPDLIFFQLNFAGMMLWLCLGHCLNTDPENFRRSFTYKAFKKLLRKG